MIILYKVHESKQGQLIAACDKNVCGKTLKTKDIEFHINPRFYAEKETTQEELTKMLRYAVSANLVGKTSVQAGIDAGVIDADKVKKIQGIPHAQFVVISI